MYIFRQQGHKKVLFSSPLPVMINQLSCNSFTYMWSLEPPELRVCFQSVVCTDITEGMLEKMMEAAFFSCGNIIYYLYTGSEDKLLFITVEKCSEGGFKWQ